MYIKVKVTPSSKKEKIEKINDNTFSISVKEPAERNLANNRVIDLIARHFNINPKKVRMISGHHNRNKMLSVDID